MLTILNFPIHEYGISLHLFKTKIFLMNICSFQHVNPARVFFSPTFALFWGPLFVAIVNGVFGVIFLGGGCLFCFQLQLLIAFRNKTYFCILTFYSVPLLNSLISYRSVKTYEAGFLFWKILNCNIISLLDRGLLTLSIFFLNDFQQFVSFRNLLILPKLPNLWGQGCLQFSIILLLMSMRPVVIFPLSFSILVVRIFFLFSCSI